MDKKVLPLRQSKPDRSPGLLVSKSEPGVIDGDITVHLAETANLAGLDALIHKLNHLNVNGNVRIGIGVDPNPSPSPSPGGSVSSTPSDLNFTNLRGLDSKSANQRGGSMLAGSFGSLPGSTDRAITDYLTDHGNHQILPEPSSLDVLISVPGREGRYRTVAMLDSGSVGICPNLVSKRMLREEFDFQPELGETMEATVELKLWPLRTNNRTGRQEQERPIRVTFRIYDDAAEEATFGDLLLGLNFIERRGFAIHHHSFVARKLTAEERAALEPERQRRIQLRGLARQQGNGTQIGSGSVSNTPAVSTSNQQSGSTSDQQSPVPSGQQSSSISDEQLPAASDQQSSSHTQSSAQ
ncbi:MAG: hypothetical protein Q9160_003560 [Pyrenula sp. 1 TL-2023]